MTTEEAIDLKAGDVVQARIAGRWVNVEVLSVNPRWISIRRAGGNSLGRHNPATKREPHELRLIGSLDRPRANVYADWLEERGQYVAARLLREAFPLDDGKPSTANDLKGCPICQGRAWLLKGQLAELVEDCRRCQGEGIAAPYTDEPCPDCQGRGWVLKG